MFIIFLVNRMHYAGTGSGVGSRRGPSSYSSTVPTEEKAADKASIEIETISLTQLLYDENES